MTRLREVVSGAPLIFVVGKGGVGKTTAAGALALEFADDEDRTHLISTDPAHSLGDLFGQRLSGPTRADCAAALILEEFDAAARAGEWTRGSIDRVAAIVEQGTYLDGSDVSAFTQLTLPGVDELMAVLRLTNLAGTAVRTVVDTAPTGHTLRMLDAAATLDGLARVLRAMADKAGAVAGGLAGRPMRLAAETVIDELRGYVEGFRHNVLDRAAFVVVDRPGAVVAAETDRLIAALAARRLPVVARVTTDAAVAGRTAASAAAANPAAAGTALRLAVPYLAELSGCDGLRRWQAALFTYDASSGAAALPLHTPVGPPPGQVPAPAPALPWLLRIAPRMLLFAGKGGVGKSTCAAAAAIALADSRDVLLCSADPAGSLADVLTGASGTGRLPPRLRTMQIEPETELARFRDAWSTDVAAALDRIGLSAAAVLDRRVIEELSHLAPPGLDELAAIAAITAHADSTETIVLDTAPTGHLLRLLATPSLALDWTRQVMRVIVRYGLSGTASGLATSLLELSRQLRALRDSLQSDASTAAIVVTLDETMVSAETERLVAALHAAGVRVVGVLHNRRSSTGGSADAAAAQLVVDDVAAGGMVAEAVSPVVITAPMVAEPTGSRALREFIGAWNIVG